MFSCLFLPTHVLQCRSEILKISGSGNPAFSLSYDQSSPFSSRLPVALHLVGLNMSEMEVKSVVCVDAEADFPLFLLVFQLLTFIVFLLIDLRSILLITILCSW